MARAGGPVPWTRLREQDEWGDLFVEVPGEVQSHSPRLLPAPSVCMNSQLGKREILGIRAGEKPMEISWSNPLVLQLIIIMITPDGSNSQRAFTSGLPRVCTRALGAGRTRMAVIFLLILRLRKLRLRETKKWASGTHLASVLGFKPRSL